MTGAELREAWPSLSPRERDARVAEALGHTLTDPALFDGARYIRHQPNTEHEFIVSLPDAGTWAVAGPLLDKLREEGWELVLEFRLGSWVVRGWNTNLAASEHEVVSGRHETAPSAIALAFCLSREAA